MTLKRKPNGAFMERSNAVTEWLPLMLTWVWHTQLQTALIAMQRFCVTQFASEIRKASQSLNWDGQADMEATGYFQSTCHRDAMRWLKKRDILARSIKDIEAVDRG